MKYRRRSKTHPTLKGKFLWAMCSSDQVGFAQRNKLLVKTKPTQVKAFGSKKSINEQHKLFLRNQIQRQKIQTTFRNKRMSQWNEYRYKRLVENVQKTTNELAVNHNSRISNMSQSIENIAYRKSRKINQSMDRFRPGISREDPWSNINSFYDDSKLYNLIPNQRPNFQKVGNSIK